MSACDSNLTYICAHTAYENIEIVTRSHPEAFPSALRQKRKTQTKVHAANEDLLKVGNHTRRTLSARHLIPSRAIIGYGKVSGVRTHGGILQGSPGTPSPSRRFKVR